MKKAPSRGRRGHAQYIRNVLEDKYSFSSPPGPMQSHAWSGQGSPFLVKLKVKPSATPDWGSG